MSTVDDDRLSALALLSAPGLGPTGYRALLSHFGSAGLALCASFDDLCRVGGIGLEVARAIRETDRGQPSSWQRATTAAPASSV